MPASEEDYMLPTASWFHAADRSLLRFYGGHSEGSFLCGPGAAALNVSISEKHGRRRTAKLAEAGLLEKKKTRYQITDLGQRYVRGDLDEEELESLNPDAGN